MLPGPGPGSVLCVIRERHVILKAALHSRLAAYIAIIIIYIIMLYFLVYIVKIFLMLVWGTYNYSYRYLAFIAKLLHCIYIYIIMIL